MEKPFGCYQNNATKKHLFLYPQGDRSGLKKPKKDKHQVSNDLTIRSDSVLANPIGKYVVPGWLI